MIKRKKTNQIKWKWVIGVAFFSILMSILGLMKYLHVQNVYAHGKRYYKIILDKNSGTHKQQNYLIIEHLHKNHIVNIDKSEISKFKVGDSISLIYDKDYDLFFKKQNDKNELWAGVGFLIFGLALIATLIFDFKT